MYFSTWYFPNYIELQYIHFFFKLINFMLICFLHLLKYSLDKAWTIFYFATMSPRHLEGSPLIMHIFIDCVAQLLILERINNSLDKNKVAFLQSQDCMRVLEIPNNINVYRDFFFFLTSLSKLFVFDHQAAFCATVMESY